MRNARLPEISVPCQVVDDDERTERWFRDLAYVPHAADARLSALVTAGEDLIASFETLLGLRPGTPPRTESNDGNDSEPST